MNIPQMVQLASTYGLENNDILEHCEQENCSIQDFCNQFSMYIAEAYAEKQLSFEYCDVVINYLYTYMVATIVPVQGEWIPEPADSIYLAFDAGEFIHQGDDADTNSPEKYTRPIINQIIADYKISK